MKREKFKLFHIVRNIKFRERMLLIYIIGGIIPFVFAMLYVNQRSQEIMLEQSKKTQSEEITLIASGMKECMNVAEDVAEQIYSNTKVINIASRVAKKDYKSTKDFDKDCSKLHFIDKYLEYYKGEISDIKIYVTNQTISTNQYFSYLSEEDKSKLRWYIPTCDRNGATYWAYGQDGTERKKVLQLTRMISDEEGNMLGVLAIQLQTAKTTEKIAGREKDSLLIYKVNDVLAASFQLDKNNRFILKCLRDAESLKDSQIVTYEVKDYLLTYERIYPDDSGTYYTIASIEDYQDLMSNFVKMGIISMGTAIIGLIVAVGLIVITSIMFGSRINTLRQQMHFVATGQFDKVEPMEGTDEAAQIYQELEQMMEDIKKLTTRVVEEKVQKEKLHTKQKEVEFKMLASQINPHFLYNTLETIRMKAKIDNEPEIEELVKMLAKIMRRNIQVGNQMVTLESEIELLENYLYIQNYRFGDRIHSEVIVDEGIDTQIMVIPLIIQPFVENAYVHGLESKESDGMLQVHVMQRKENIIIEIQDNGVGMSYYKLAKIRKSLHEGEISEKGHIGISNVNQRLRLMYGEEYGVSIYCEPDKGTRITVCFPKKKKEELLEVYTKNTE